MIIRNTDDRYGLLTVLFHWLIAVLIIGLLGLGLYMTDLEFSPGKLVLYGWHKSFGIVVLALVILRLSWKILNAGKPRALPTHKPWEKILAKIAHLALYAAMFIMPLSGWIMSSAKGYPVSVFGWFTLPDLVSKNKALGDLAGNIHDTAAWILIGIIGLHIAGALKHHLVDRDGTLRRILPGMILVVSLAGLSPAHAQGLPVWTIDKTASRLTFEGTQNGTPFTGSFGTFAGSIVFDPDRLDKSHVTVTIDMHSADLSTPDWVRYAKDPVWLDSESFPESVYSAKKFEKTGDHSYVAKGSLTLKGLKLPVDLPFTLDIAIDENGHKIAKVTAETKIDRLLFSVGAGEWADPKTLAPLVTVKINLMARNTPETSPGTPVMGPPRPTAPPEGEN